MVLSKFHETEQGDWYAQRAVGLKMTCALGLLVGIPGDLLLPTAGLIRSHRITMQVTPPPPPPPLPGAHLPACPLHAKNGRHALKFNW